MKQKERRRKLPVYYGYILAVIGLVPGYFGFSYLNSGLYAWGMGRGYRDLLISLPLLALAFGLGYSSAALTAGNHEKNGRSPQP